MVQSPPDSGGVRLPLRCHVDISRSASTSVASPTRVEPPPSLSLLWPIQFDVFVGEFLLSIASLETNVGLGRKALRVGGETLNKPV